MKSEVIFPCNDRRSSPNTSCEFLLDESGKFIETFTLDLPAGKHVSYQRAFQFSDCSDLEWIAHADPCCSEIFQTTQSVLFTIPGRYRAVIMNDNGQAPNANELQGARIVSVEYEDVNGSLVERHKCCTPPTLCDQIADLPEVTRIGG